MSKGDLIAIPKGDDSFSIETTVFQEDKAEVPTYDRVTAEKVEAVIARIESGESERAACRSENVSRSSFRIQALRADAGNQYARALYGLAHDQVDRMEEVLQRLESGDLDPQTARVLVDTRKWFASKFLPKQYGDKIDHTTNGKDMVIPILGGITTPEELTE